MKLFVSIMMMVMMFATLSVNMGCSSAEANLPPLTEKSIYDFSMKSIDGKDIQMSEFKDKVLLVVNVASR